jgi:hypothetical protein
MKKPTATTTMNPSSSSSSSSQQQHQQQHQHHTQRHRHEHPLTTSVTLGDSHEYLAISSTGQSAIDAYIQYHHLLADTPNDELLPVHEYESLKAKIMAHRSNPQNRIYVCWYNIKRGIECRQIG